MMMRMTPVRPHPRFPVARGLHPGQTRNKQRLHGFYPEGVSGWLAAISPTVRPAPRTLSFMDFSLTPDPIPGSRGNVALAPGSGRRSLVAEIYVYVGQDLSAKYAIEHGEYLIGRDEAATSRSMPSASRGIMRGSFSMRTRSCWRTSRA